MPQTSAADSPTRRRITVAVGILERAGRLLVQKRPTHVRLGGFWEFPGGKLEPDESAEACVLRELSEELGVVAQVDRALPMIVHDDPDLVVELRPFLCSVVSGEPAPLAADELRWIERAQLKDYRFPPANGELLALLMPQA